MLGMETTKKYTAFVAERLIGAGVLEELLPKLKAEFDRDRGTLFLIFDDETGEQVDFDLRGTVEEVLARNGRETPQTGPGRPKLGVTPREVTLLPRHWDWLGLQPGGASAAIRRLIDEERKRNPEKAHRTAGHSRDRAVSLRHGRQLPRVRGGHACSLSRRGRAVCRTDRCMAAGRACIRAATGERGIVVTGGPAGRVGRARWRAQTPNEPAGTRCRRSCSSTVRL